MNFSNFPPAYAEAFERLSRSRPPGVDGARHGQAVADAATFLRERGYQACRAGWTAEDLFDEPGPDHLGGLVWRLAGASVVYLTPHDATIERGPTSISVVRRTHASVSQSPAEAERAIVFSNFEEF